MALYHLLLDENRYYRHIHPALTASWQRRTFEPCQQLALDLAPVIQANAGRFHTGPEEPLLARIDRLPFDRLLWRALVGEVLWFAAAEVPHFQTLPETFTCLLAPERPGAGEVDRAQLAPIQQAHYGSRDVVFGSGFYRPDQAGLNDAADVAHLAAYLAGVDPSRWTVADLEPLADLADEEERADELELAREWFPALRDLYRQAAEHRQVVIAEIIS